MKYDGSESPLNRLAEFRNKTLERAFYNSYINHSRNHIGLFSVLWGGFFFSMFFFDWAAFGTGGHTCFNFISRTLILLFSGVLALVSLKAKSCRLITTLFLLYEVVFIVTYHLTLYINNNTGFMDQAIAFLLILFVSFMFPYRWLHGVLVSVAIAVEFLYSAPFYLREISAYQYFGVMIYFALAIVLGAISSYNLNVYRRRQYLRQNQLEKLSNTDRLTNIYNRQMFDQTFREWVNIASSEEMFFSVIMFDLDNFKNINDTMGHVEGDKVLVECVNLVSVGLRDDDLFARWGGEEFMILLPRTELETARIIAERLRSNIEIRFKETGAGITASFGVTRYREGDTTDGIITRVDANLYKAKQQGKNCVCYS